MRRVDTKVRQSLQESQWGEAKAWIVNKCVKPCLKSDATGPLVRMRWVLTVKGDGKAKARLVVLGFQEAGLAELRTESPTCSKRARHLLVQVAANNRWTLHKGDVRKAFLQGSRSIEHRNVVCQPVPELAA